MSNRQRITMTFEVEGFSDHFIEQLKATMTPWEAAQMRFPYSNFKVTAEQVEVAAEQVRENKETK